MNGCFEETDRWPVSEERTDYHLKDADPEKKYLVGKGLCFIGEPDLSK